MLTQIEGERWRRQQEAGEFGNTSFPFMKAAYELWLKDGHPGLSFYPGRYSVALGYSPNCCGTIYGAGGFNRYYVQDDGRIEMIKGLARCQEDMEKARALGIDIL